MGKTFRDKSWEKDRFEHKAVKKGQSKNGVVKRKMFPTKTKYKNFTDEN